MINKQSYFKQWKKRENNKTQTHSWKKNHRSTRKFVEINEFVWTEEILEFNHKRMLMSSDVILSNKNSILFFFAVSMSILFNYGEFFASILHEIWNEKFHPIFYRLKKYTFIDLTN